ncbi:MAG: pilus assembly protein PilM [Phycisphaerales bacterium]|nr:pilus assembly protein PilM [Phycisphaerales bacterium]
MTMGPIGLDVGSTRIKAVQVRHAPTGPELVHSTSIQRIRACEEFGPADAARLAGVLRRQGFEGQRVVMCMPPGKLLSGVMELPPVSSGAPLDQIARQELARATKSDPGAIEVSWWVLPGGARAAEGTHAMAVGCRHEDAFALLDTMEAAQMDVLAIDAPATALAAAVAPMSGSGGELSGVVDIGHSGAMVVMLLGRMVVYERVLGECGVGRLIDGLAKRLGIDRGDAEVLLTSVGCRGVNTGQEAHPARRTTDDEGVRADVRAAASGFADALIGELRLSMSYAMRRFDAPMPRVLLTGGAAAMPGLAERVSEQLDVECRVPGLVEVCAADEQVAPRALGPEGMLALGLALHSGSGGHS